MIELIKNADTNVITLISGILSMLGGALGALGAYFVATHQTRKQFEKQDNDRVLELRIEKLNQALTITNDYLNHLQKIKGKFGNVEKYVNECFKKNYTHIGENPVLNKVIVSELLEEIRKCSSYKNELKKYKIFTPESFNYQSIFNNTSELINYYKIYFREFDDFPNSISVAKLNAVHFNLVGECDKSYVVLEKVLIDAINILEVEIQKLLKLN